MNKMQKLKVMDSRITKQVNQIIIKGENSKYIYIIYIESFT
jgi:hypothetical protein